MQMSFTLIFLAHFLLRKKPRFSGVPPPKTAAATRPSNRLRTQGRSNKLQITMYSVQILGISLFVICKNLCVAAPLRESLFKKFLLSGRNAEKPASVCRCFRGYGFRILPQMPAGGPRDVGKKTRFVSAAFRAGGFFVKVAGQEEGSVRFEHQPVLRDHFQKFAEMSAPPFVADPAGNAYVAAQLEVRVQFLYAAGKAVDNGGLYGAYMVV
jgi:hypothetical protein